MANTTTKLNVNSRDAAGSRAVRRLRRSGRVPGVLYGGGGEPVGFDADERELRHALAGSGAVLDLSIDGAESDARGPQGGPAPSRARRDRPRRPAAREPQRGDPARSCRSSSPASTTRPASRKAACSSRSRASSTSKRCRRRSPSRSSHDVGEMEIGDTILLGALAAAGRRDAARRPRGDGRRDAVAAAPAERNRRRDRSRDGASSARRRAGRATRAPPARSSSLCDARSAVAVAAASRLAGRRAGQPRPRVRGHASQRRLHGRGGARRALGARHAPRTASADASPKAACARAADARRRREPRR